MVIAGGILAVLLILLLAPVSVRAAYTGGELYLSAHYLLLRIPLFPPPPAKPAKKRKRKPEPPPPEEEAEKPKHPLNEHLALLRELAEPIKRALNILRRHIVMYKVRLEIVVATEDAHKTAIAYGNTANLTAIGLALLDTLIVLKKPYARILPDFTRDSSVYNISFRIRIRPLFALAALAGLFIAYIGELRRAAARKKASAKKQRRKLQAQ